MLIAARLNWLSRQTNLRSVAEIVSTTEHPVATQAVLDGLDHLVVLPEPVLTRLVVLWSHLLFLTKFGGYDPRPWLDEAKPLLKGRETKDLDPTLALLVE